MDIYPAIDLMDGRCVRLTEGDFAARTDYGDDPAAIASSYKEAGSKWLHLVDLDGARDPAKRQLKAIAAIVSAAGLQVQTGGGVRSADDVMALLDHGVTRVIVGSLCVKEPEVTADMLRRFGAEKIVLALDVRAGADGHYYVATAGWKDVSVMTIDDVLARYTGLVKHVLCTDIAKDGKLAGPNVALYAALKKTAPNLEIQASGGVSSLEDLAALKRTGVSSAIVGKALYEGRFGLRDALRSAA
jgi:phosphoribosylformimino-5-aminoimidazole carboxamide ribotide isomerase